jgi:hypothetical protein
VVEVCSSCLDDAVEGFRVAAQNLLIELNGNLLVSIPTSPFLSSASYLDDPVLALAMIVLSLVLHHVTLTGHNALGNLMAQKWQKTSSPPSVGLINPKPRGFHLSAQPLRRLLLLIFLFVLKSPPIPSPVSPPSRPQLTDSNLLQAAPKENALQRWMEMEGEQTGHHGQNGPSAASLPVWTLQTALPVWSLRNAGMAPVAKPIK